MKILITNDGGHAHYFIRLGLAKAFQACGHQVHIWEVGSSPVYDIFDEFEPDILLTQTYNVNNSMIECIQERPHLKVIMKASDWGVMQEKIDLVEYPILVAQSKEKDLIQKLVDLTGQPGFIHCHYHPNRIESTHGYWNKEFGIKVVGLMSGADIFDYTNGTPRESFKSDLTFVGGCWGYKAKTLTKYIHRLCNVDRKFKIKIFGNGGWGVPQYCGFLPTEFVKDALISATICPNISEPHSQAFGYDIVERPWKILSNKCFCISDYVDSMAKDVFTNEEIVFAHSPEEFEHHILHFLRYPYERLPYIERGYENVINNHTYFQRIQTIFDNLNMPWDANNVKTVYKEIKESLCPKS